MESDKGDRGARDLLDAVSRLSEVRRRFVFDAGDGERYVLAEERLDAIILDLKGWLKPGGAPIDLGELGLRLSAVEEMIEGLGFPGYAHVIGSVRRSLVELVESPNDGDEPPPPRRFEPPAGRAAGRPARVARAGSRASKPRPAGRRPDRVRAAVLIAAAAVLAAVLAMVLGPRPQPRTGPAAGPSAPVRPLPIETAEPDPTPVPRMSSEPGPPAESFEDAVRTRARLGAEVGAADAAIAEGDLERALQHFAAAAAIDRYHRRVTTLARRLVDALLDGAEGAFDDGEWERANELVADARRIARGFYLDTSKVDQTARNLATMTRFSDVGPADRTALRGAVGRVVRVTLGTRDELLGRLEAVEGDRLVLSIHSGIEGGGAEFSRSVALAEVARVRVYDAERVSELILAP